MANYLTYAEYLGTAIYRGVRKYVMHSHGHQCKHCGARATEVHHVRYPFWGSWDAPSNMEPVCHACHCKIENKPT